ncbi:hypothetical protein D3C75_1384170 [compost metagenome]
MVMATEAVTVMEVGMVILLTMETIMGRVIQAKTIQTKAKKPRAVMTIWLP